MSFTCKYGGLCNGCMRCQRPARGSGFYREDTDMRGEGDEEASEGGVEIGKEAEARGQFDRQLKAVELTEKAIQRALKDKDQFKRYIVNEKRGADSMTEERLMERVDFKALGDLVKTLRELEELKRSLLGMTDGQEDGRGGIVIMPEIRDEDEQ